MRQFLGYVIVLLLSACPMGVARAQGTPPPADPGAPEGSEEPRTAPTTPEGPGFGEALERGERPIGGLAVLSGPIDPRTYRVGPGDVLRLHFWGRVSRSLLLEVGPEGFVLLPGAGTLRVEGRTLAVVRDDVIEVMKREFRGVNMDLRLARPRIFRVYLTGQVRSPGPLTASGVSRVGDVLVASTLRSEASQRRIEIVHRDGSHELADLDLFHTTGNPQFNPALRDGDVINVPTATGFIGAQGALARPGRYELGPLDSLATLLRIAGGPLPSADAERALLVRWKSASESESLSFRLPDVASGAFNPVLREGDRVFVYFVPQFQVQQQVTILGQVARPGVYPIIEGSYRLSDLVREGGGFLENADLSAIRLNRGNRITERDPEMDRLLRLSRNELTSSEYEKLRTKLAGLREDYRINWNRLQRGGPLDLLMRDGDVVRVERLVPSIQIDGEVRYPGILAYRPGQDIEDYVRQAGGFTDRAWPGRVRVTRAVTGQTLQARSVTTLDPGDLVWVPEKPDVSAWDHARNVLTAVAQIATVVIAIRSVR